MILIKKIMKKKIAGIKKLAIFFFIFLESSETHFYLVARKIEEKKFNYVPKFKKICMWRGVGEGDCLSLSRTGTNFLVTKFK